MRVVEVQDWSGEGLECWGRFVGFVDYAAVCEEQGSGGVGERERLLLFVGGVVAAGDAKREGDAGRTGVESAFRGEWRVGC